MDPKAKKRLGRADVWITQLGLGCLPLGELFVRLSDGTAQGVLQTAWDAGIRYFDTAPEYGMGLSEHRVGQFVRQQPRDEFVLSTKVGRILRAPPKPAEYKHTFWVGGLDFDYVFDYSYDGVMRSFEDSLQRLGLNRVDVLLIHDLDLYTHVSETKLAAFLGQLLSSGWSALEKLRAGGAIKAIGAGLNDRSTVLPLLETTDLDFLMLATTYTLLDNDTLDAELPRCVERNIDVVVGGVFNSGILATGAVPGASYNYAPASPSIMDRVARIEAVCRRHEVPLPAAALQFPLGHPSIASVIPGADAPAHVQTNLANFRYPIPKDFWDELRAENLIREDAPTPEASAARVTD